MTRQPQAASRLLNRKKLGSFVITRFDRLKLKLEILLRGGDRVVTMDGCRFPLRGVPDTLMKLELLRGGYERPEREAVSRYIPRERPVVELGGCIGVVACITNRILQHPSAHVVLEANPLVIPNLRSNRDGNGCSFKVINKALAYESDAVTFTPLPDYWGNSPHYVPSHQPPVTVEATRLRDILKDEHFEAYTLICDIEGYEYELVMQEPDAIAKAELIIMEVHPHMIGEEKVRVLLSRLADLGFETVERSALVVVLSRAHRE